MKPAAFLVTLILLTGCGQRPSRSESAVEAPTFEQPPVEVTDAILGQFPGAMPFAQALDSVLDLLTRRGIQPNGILWAKSTCVDDITNTKEKLLHSEIKGPFILSGLAGLPFTGITGLGAFLHHVPTDGTALISVGPHIGYSEESGWGTILRHGQHHGSSCCGALSAALKKYRDHALTVAAPTSEDYQEQVIEQLALKHGFELDSAREPMITLAHITAVEAEQNLRDYVARVDDRDFSFLVLVTGVIINTDHNYPDYVWIKDVAIKDIRKNTWVQ